MRRKSINKITSWCNNLRAILLTAFIFISISSVANAGTWDLEDPIPSGGSATLTITVTVDPGTGGSSITNIVTKTQDQTDTDATADDMTETITVNNDADIVVGKTVNDNTPDEGDTITFTVTVTNSGPAQVENLTVTDALPSGLTLVSAVPSVGTWTDPNWTITTLADGASATLTVTATVDAGTSGDIITNEVTHMQDQLDSDTTADDLTEAITVNNDADIVITKTVDNSTPSEGDTITFTVGITNSGPAQATNLVVTDAVPAGLTVTGATPTVGTWADPTWTIGTLNNGASASLTITATVDANTGGQTITNEVTHTQDQLDSDTTADDPSEAVTVSNDTDLVVTKTVDNSTPNEGDTVTYTITIQNNGPTQVNNLEIEDILPPGVTLVDPVNDVNPSQGTFTP